MSKLNIDANDPWETSDSQIVKDIREMLSMLGKQKYEGPYDLILIVPSDQKQDILQAINKINADYAADADRLITGVVEIP